MDESRNPEQRGNTDLLKSDLLVEIEADILKKVHKMITDDLNHLNPLSKGKGSKKGKGKGKKKKNEEDDEKEDEETRKEAEAKKMDKLFVKKAGINLPSRRDNFSEMVKHRFLRKVRPIDIKDLVGSFDYIAHEKIIATLEQDQGT